MHPDPIARFVEIFEQAQAMSRELIPEPTAMSVATVSAHGQPSVRIVLLKDFDARGFVFYTNFEGRKGRELTANPRTALCFHWAQLETQVRVEGTASPVDPVEADAYFATRQRESQLGAWASSQSEPMAGEEELVQRLADFEKKFSGSPVPRPPHWSGFRVAPERIEFWHNRPGRLHERHLYIRSEDQWHTRILFP